MHDVVVFLPLGVILLAVALAMWLLVRWERRQASIWTPVAEGEFDRAEYGYHVESRRSGAMVHTTSYYRMEHTVVWFTDGRTCVLRGRRDMPYPRGTKLRIQENGLGSRRLERLDQ